MSGVSNGSYQIPNNPGQTPAFTAFGVSNFDSSLLNERQNEFNQFNVLAYQKSVDGIDYQLSYFNRYSQLHFMPDTIGDLVFNGVASDVYRQSFINGIQEDTSWRVGFAHTLRFGFSVSAERSLVNNASAGAAARCHAGNPDRDAPFSGVRFQRQDRLAVRHLSSGRMEDHQPADPERRTAVRPDVPICRCQPAQPAHQPDLEAVRRHHVPRRLCAKLHAAAAGAGGADQSRAGAPNTTRAARRCRSTIRCCRNAPTCSTSASSRRSIAIPGLEVGIDGYYKTARDLLDDGQFGAAYVLTGFNYDRGENVGVELKATYTNGNFRAYGNLAWAKQIATNVVSNQYLFDPDELAYIASHYVYTDHAQLLTASAGASYLWNGTRFSASMIYGSGLRAGFANTDTVPSYTQVNLGLSHDFNIVAPNKPTTLRFDVVNLFDTIYEIRDGSGIGVFAPQFGPRRGFYCRHFAEAVNAPSELSRHAPVRTDRAGNIGERAIDEFRHQQAVVVDRSRHGRPALRNRLEADAAVIGLVADQQHQAMALGLGVLQRALQQRAADAAAAKRRLDRQRPQQQRPGIADADRQLAHRTHQQRADPGRERQIEQMIDMLAEAGRRSARSGPARRCAGADVRSPARRWRFRPIL